MNIVNSHLFIQINSFSFFSYPFQKYYWMFYDTVQQQFLLFQFPFYFYLSFRKCTTAA